jgi:hypothetical protein
MQDTTGSDTSGRNENLKRKEVEKGEAEIKEVQGACKKCGKVGHKTEECFRPVVCSRCKKEGHIPRVCSEIAPWEHIAPFCGLAAPELGFHIIHDEDSGEGVRDSSNFALITIKEGEVTARQVEGEFKAQAGSNSTWRWFAKKVAEIKFQMKFPTATKVEELAFFNGMMMGTVPGATFKVEPWNPNVGAKAKLQTAWFRISGIPIEKRSDKRACLVASLVGIPLEVDKVNLKRWEYVRVKIGCKDVTKVPAVVEGLLDMHFYDFTFQREIQVEGHTQLGWNTWTRTNDGNDNPSPKNQKEMREKVIRGRLLVKMMMKLELPHNTMASSRLQEEWWKVWQIKRRLQIKIT